MSTLRSANERFVQVSNERFVHVSNERFVQASHLLLALLSHGYMKHFMPCPSDVCALPQ
jgi:hypothetical protein